MGFGARLARRFFFEAEAARGLGGDAVAIGDIMAVEREIAAIGGAAPVELAGRQALNFAVESAAPDQLAADSAALAFARAFRQVGLDVAGPADTPDQAAGCAHEDPGFRSQ